MGLGKCEVINWQKILPFRLKIQTDILTRSRLEESGLQKFRWIARTLEPGKILGPIWGSCYLGPIWGHLGPIFYLFGAHWGPFGVIRFLGPFGPIGPSLLSPLGGAIGPRRNQAPCSPRCNQAPGPCFVSIGLINPWHSLIRPTHPGRLYGPKGVKPEDP